MLVQVGKPEQLDAHFNNILNAFITVFIIITCDNWTDIMFPMMSVSGQAGTSVSCHCLCKSAALSQVPLPD